VTLEGEVQSAEDRRRAVDLARGTEGVTSVADHLRVVGAEAPVQSAERADRDAAMGDADRAMDISDPWVTAKIESKYFLDADVKGRKIDVSTQDGIVTLSGDVSSAAERRQAVALARATDGVKDVRDNLRVTAASAPEPPAAAGASPRAMASARIANDDWIETRIQSRFFLEDELKTEEIEISSASGKVTLDGAVDSADAKETAEEIARETSGVDTVINRIAVAPSPAPPVR
jgi:hyperosmotically inducible protein